MFERTHFTTTKILFLLGTLFVIIAIAFFAFLQIKRVGNFTSSINQEKSNLKLFDQSISKEKDSVEVPVGIWEDTIGNQIKPNYSGYQIYVSGKVKSIDFGELPYTNTDGKQEKAKTITFNVIVPSKNSKELIIPAMILEDGFVSYTSDGKKFYLMKPKLVADSMKLGQAVRFKLGDFNNSTTLIENMAKANNTDCKTSNLCQQYLSLLQKNRFNTRDLLNSYTRGETSNSIPLNYLIEIGTNN